MSIIERISRTTFARSAIADKADLSAFKKKPSFRIVSGMVVICISYVMAWPTIAVLGYFAVSDDNAWLLAIGGTLLYGLSHLVFLLGLYLAGYDYTKIFLRWTTRVWPRSVWSLTLSERCPV